MTNEELLCRLESILKERGMTLYELQKQSREEVIKGSTFYSILRSREIVPRFWYKTLAIIFASP